LFFDKKKRSLNHQVLKILSLQIHRNKAIII